MCAALCGAERKKILSSTDQREKVIKGKIISNLYGVDRGVHKYKSADRLLAAWPCAEVRVCAHATGRVTENIWCNWSPDPGFRHLKMYAADFRELIIPLCSLSPFCIDKEFLAIARYVISKSTRRG